MNSSNLYIGNSGGGTLTICNSGAVTNSCGFVGNVSNAMGVITVEGVGSTWTNSSSLFVGNSGSGTLTIRGGGVVDNSDGYVGYSAAAKGVVTVNGVGSTWTNSSSLSVGSSGGGTLSITGGGLVSATNVSVNSKSLLVLDVGDSSSLVVGNGSGATTNNGRIRIVAGAGVAADGTGYSPISTGSWGGTGTYQSMGGIWDATGHTFAVSSVTSGTSGSAVALDLASVQRALIDDSGTGWEVGASFLAATSTKNVTFKATAMSGTTLTALESLLSADELVLGGWNFATTNYTVSSTNPVYLSFNVGEGYSEDEFDLWHYNGSVWAQYTPADLTYDGTYASFTASSFSGYAITAVPEPSTLVLLAAAVLGLRGYARRQRIAVHKP